MLRLLRLTALAAAVLVFLPLPAAAANVPVILSMKQVGNTIHCVYRVPDWCDHVHLRWGERGREESTAEERRGYGDALGRFTFIIRNVRPNTEYVFKVSGVKKHTFGHDECTPWAEKWHRAHSTQLFRVVELVNRTGRPVTFTFRFRSPRAGETQALLAKSGPGSTKLLHVSENASAPSDTPPIIVRYSVHIRPNGGGAGHIVKREELLQGRAATTVSERNAHRYEFFLKENGQLGLRPLR